MRAYVVQQAPLKNEAKDKNRGMYSTLRVLMTSFCNVCSQRVSKRGKAVRLISGNAVSITAKESDHPPS